MVDEGSCHARYLEASSGWPDEPHDGGPMMRWTLSLGLLILVAGCGGNDASSPSTATRNTATTQQTSTTGAEGYDPYQEFLALGGTGLWAQDAESCVGFPVMCGRVCCSLISEDPSPEDAQTRALSGCGTEWSPGSLDAMLAEAYRQVDGFCGSSSS
jgi:hypothetical protein